MVWCAVTKLGEARSSLHELQPNALATKKFLANVAFTKDFMAYRLLLLVRTPMCVLCFASLLTCVDGKRLFGVISTWVVKVQGSCFGSNNILSVLEILIWIALDGS